MPRRCLVLVTTTSYRTEAFLAAARALGVEVVIGSDRCHQLAELWPDEAFRGAFDGSVQLDYRDARAAAAQIVSASTSGASGAGRSFDAIVATDDATAYIAALASRALGLLGNAPDATWAARNKAEMRRRLTAADVPSPAFLCFDESSNPALVAASVRASFGFPCVIKPILLSTSRGVIRTDDEITLAAAWLRVADILHGRAEYHDGSLPDARRILVESFVPGVEVALEGILSRGQLRTLAIYDKPDPLDGPFFEETLYITPSRHPVALQRRISEVAAAAAAALGLVEGPVHAELRLASGNWEAPSVPVVPLVPVLPVVIEIAARSIGGLCARTLRYTLGGDGGHALEELVLRHALALDVGDFADEGGAAGVMMLPVPCAGVLRGVAGVDEAKSLPLVEDVVITAKVGERLVPPPEGASYPGFIFARGADPLAVENALREAHRRLRFDIAPIL